MKKKSLFLAAGIAVFTLVAALIVLGVGSVSAFRQGDGSLIENLANKFGVSEDEVEEVFEETRIQRIDGRLSEFVEAGTITEEQKQLIIEKMEELHEQREENFDADMTMEERHELREAHRQEIENWMEENDIPKEVMMPRMGRGRMGRVMRMRKRAGELRRRGDGECMMD